MRNALLAFTMVSTAAFSQNSMTQKELDARQAWRHAADKVPGLVCHYVETRTLDKKTDYEVAKEMGEPELCLRRYACFEDMGPYVIPQLEKDKKGQVFAHRYAVLFKCRPDGSSYKIIKRID